MANDYAAAGEGWAAGETGQVEGVAEAIEAPQTEAPAAPPTPAPVDKGNIPPTLNESSESWARDDKGRFAPKAEDAQAEETPQATTPEDAERPATQAEIAAVVRAQLNGKDIDIPENLMIPMVRHGKVEMVPLKQVQAEGMMERDYRIKTGEVSRMQQEVAQAQARAAAENARATERAKMLQEEYQGWQEAKKDPAKLAQWEAHYNQMANNPLYRKNWEDAQRFRETEAENAVLREREETRLVHETTRQLSDQITAMAADYPGVSAEKIKQQYGLILKAGEVDTIDMRHVQYLYQQEAQNVASLRGPVQEQVESLTKELETLRKLQAATASNASTDQKIARAKAPNLTPSGTPQSHVKPSPKPYTPDQAEEVRRNWSRVRD